MYSFAKEVQMDNRQENVFIVISDQEFKSRVKLMVGWVEGGSKKIVFLFQPDWQKSQGLVEHENIGFGWQGNHCLHVLLMTV